MHLDVEKYAKWYMYKPVLNCPVFKHCNMEIKYTNKLYRKNTYQDTERDVTERVYGHKSTVIQKTTTNVDLFLWEKSGDHQQCFIHAAYHRKS